MENNTSPPNNQDNLLLVNELKKVNQKLSEIQKDNLINQNQWQNLDFKLKTLQYSFIGIFVLLVIGLLSNFLNFKPEKYEYQVVSPSDYIFDDKMNEYGEQGWKATECRRAVGSDDESSYECIMIRKK